MPRRKKRLDPSAFNLPVDQSRSGFFTGTFFGRARDVLLAEGRSLRDTMQVTGKQVGYLGGIDASIAVLRLCVADWGALAVNALLEGDFYDDWETVLTIEGPYESFAHLETVVLGLLGRGTKICSNA